MQAMPRSHLNTLLVEQGENGQNLFIFDVRPLWKHDAKELSLRMDPA